MRTIKFRGKSILDDSDRRWLYGDLSTDRLKEGRCTIWDENNPFSGYYVDPETVGQFTGLCDKNGKEIYEGDIVEFIYVPKDFYGIRKPNEYKDRRIVRWCDQKRAFVYEKTIEWKGKHSRNVLHRWMGDGCVCDIEVIGNIHDNHNPEPLEGGGNG